MSRGDGFLRTFVQPLLQGQLVAVAALAAGSAGRLVGVGGALLGARGRVRATLRALSVPCAAMKACGRARSVVG